MIDIKTIYFIKTTDKSPYVFDFDSNIFNSISLPLTENYIITELNLDKAVYKFEGCARINLDYSLEQGYEKKIPFSGFNGLFNYSINIIRKSVNYFDFPDSLSLNKIMNDRYQVIFTTFDNLTYIIYAEMIPEPIEMKDDTIFQVDFIADNVKEGIFRINTLDVSSLTIENDFSETPSVLPLEIIMSDVFVV